MIPFGRMHIHCIGIGGAGMAPLAEVLHARGCTLSGSDRSHSALTRRLERLGIRVHYGHDTTLAGEADLVVYSSAIRPDNPERRLANERGVPQYRRAAIVGDLMRGMSSTAVAGTHGKTTTTAILGHILAQAGRDPTVLVGGEVSALGSNAMIGRSEVLVTEADEFDRSFLSMYPTIAAITNIEADHLDCYRDIDDIREAFTAFADSVPFYGSVVACSDDEGVRAVLKRIHRPVLTCGISTPADYQASFRVEAGQSRVTVRQGDTGLGSFTLALPGEHNVRNALLAAVTALRLGVAFDDIAAAVDSFAGVRRRLETIGTVNGVRVVDDYAHHPTEIRMSLQALRSMGAGRLIVLFQPHLYSRTRDFAAEFCQSLMSADAVLVLDIYAAREEAIAGVSAAALAQGLCAGGHQAAWHASSIREALSRAVALARPGDTIVTMGAGDVTEVAPLILEELRHGASNGC